MRFFFLIIILSLSCCYAQSSGCRTLQNKKMDSYINEGFLQATRCDFHDFLHVNGTFMGHKCQIYELKVNGTADIHECIIHGPSFIVGVLKADHSVFKKPLSITCQASSFNRCVVLEDILIKKSGNSEGKQVLKVKNGTIIHGNITFDSKDGLILLSKDSEIKGGVVGGHIQLFVE